MLLVLFFFEDTSLSCDTHLQLVLDGHASVLHIFHRRVGPLPLDGSLHVIHRLVDVVGLPVDVVPLAEVDWVQVARVGWPGALLPEPIGLQAVLEVRQNGDARVAGCPILHPDIVADAVDAVQDGEDPPG